MAELVTLAECPPGLFRFKGSLGFKSEYGAMESVGPTDVPGKDLRWTVGNRPDAYCADTGEYFWGGAKTKEERDALMVEPVAGELLLFPSEISVWPRDEAGRAPDPVAHVLSLAAAPWSLMAVYRALQQAGQPIPKRAEAEVAAAVHFLLVRILRDPEAGLDKAVAELKAMASPTPEPDDETEACGICQAAFNEGDDCLTDVDLGAVHAACCGPERESYVNLETGEPIGPNDPIPTPWKWSAQ